MHFIIRGGGEEGLGTRLQVTLTLYKLKIHSRKIFIKKSYRGSCVKKRTETDIDNNDFDVR